MKRLLNWLCSNWSWVCAVLVITAGLISLVVLYWEWFATEPCGMESRSTTARNVGILFFGLLAIGFGIWRGVVASRQAKTSQRGLLNERYQKGAEMIGSKVLSVRLGGIYALQRLAADEPEQYHVQIMLLLSAFVRNPTKDQEYNATPSAGVPELNIKDYLLREDIQAALTVICTRSDDDIKLEKEAKNYRLNLTQANLTGANLSRANLTDAFLGLTNLTGADLSHAKGLTQAQLERAGADPANPPDFGDLCDPTTSAPLQCRRIDELLK